MLRSPYLPETNLVVQIPLNLFRQKCGIDVVGAALIIILRRVNDKYTRKIMMSWR